MHAVAVSVTIKNPEAAQASLRDQVVPMVSGAPGFVVEAVRVLEPFCGEFLYTHVDKEGLMKGTDLAAITSVRNATRRPLIAAGGVTTQEEIDELDRLGVDAVVGMAIYTGALDLDRALTRRQTYGTT